jgi:hypothetical protein
MSQRSWQPFSAEVSRALNRSSCQSGFDDSFRAANVAAFTALEEQARFANFDDALLGMIAPAAEGDFILVLRTYGHPANMSSHRPPGATLVAHGGGAEVLKSDVAPRLMAPAAPRPEISASLFSVTARRTVVEVVMEYSGASRDEAVKSFAEKLGSSLPNWRCVGWNWSAVTTADELDDAGILIRRSLVPVRPQ